MCYPPLKSCIYWVFSHQWSMKYCLDYLTFVTRGTCPHYYQALSSESEYSPLVLCFKWVTCWSCLPRNLWSKSAWHLICLETYKNFCCKCRRSSVIESFIPILEHIKVVLSSPYCLSPIKKISLSRAIPNVIKSFFTWKFDLMRNAIMHLPWNI